MDNEKIEGMLKLLSGKEKIILTRRGNKALKFILRELKEKGFSRLLIADQGGWVTYPQYGEELGFNVIRIKTDMGLIDIDNLKSECDSDSVVLANSMPGYFCYENMDAVCTVAGSNDAFVVNDASGSIGTDKAKKGNVIFGSFGRWKPVDLGYGGFIACNNDFLEETVSVFDEKHIQNLAEKLENLVERRKFLENKSSEIKSELNGFDIIHPEHLGFNVVVRFISEDEKEKILKYCEKKRLEWTECPRYIRVDKPAISIEIKRLEKRGA